MTVREREFGGQVEHLFAVYGWEFYHVIDTAYYARRTSSGFPDYCAARRGRVLFVEIKGSTGKVSDEQWKWINLLSENTGVECYIWRPDALETEIVEVLSRE